MSTISLKTAKKRLSHRQDLILCDNFYIGWSKKAKFYDKIEQDYFEAIPRNVIKYNSGHPDRGNKKRKQTLLKTYGVDNPLKSKKIQEKIKQTLLKKYGVDNPQKSKFIKKKTIKTLQSKYQTTNPARLRSKRFINETGEHLFDWYKKTNGPKPAYSTLIHHIENNNIKMCELEQLISLYKSPKTFLESASEELFETKHYNKKPNKKINHKPDFKLSDTVYLNVDGLYWHSEKIQTNKYYHFNMRKCFEECGLRIIQFREDEIRDKPKICKSVVNNAINNTSNKIYANKCVVKNVHKKEAEIFLNNNHLLGNINAKHIGLYCNKQLVSLLSYKEKKYICKIERFCSLIDHDIVDGFSKLLKHLEKHCLKSTITEIHSWIDLKYETGKHLLSTGFIRKEDKLNWGWTNYKNTFNKLKCRANMDDRNLNQQQHADELKWSKIYDAGQRLHVKEL